MAKEKKKEENKAGYVLMAVIVLILHSLLILAVMIMKIYHNVGFSELKVQHKCSDGRYSSVRVRDDYCISCGEEVVFEDLIVPAEYRICRECGRTGEGSFCYKCGCEIDNIKKPSEIYKVSSKSGLETLEFFSEHWMGIGFTLIFIMGAILLKREDELLNSRNKNASYNRKL